MINKRKDAKTKKHLKYLQQKGDTKRQECKQRKQKN